jgi:hypothetical protein
VKIGYLVKQLQKLDPDLEVLCMREDTKSYEITNVDDDIPTLTLAIRDRNQKARATFDGPDSRPIVYLEISEDF